MTLVLCLAVLPGVAATEQQVHAFHGSIRAEAGLQLEPLGGQVGPLHADGEQVGILPVPEGAQVVELTVHLERRLPAEAEVLLRACRGSCEAIEAEVVLLERASGTDRIHARTSVVDVKELGWELRVHHGLEVGTAFTGQATFLHAANVGASLPAPGGDGNVGTATWTWSSPLLLAAWAALVTVQIARRVPSGPLVLAGLYHRIRDADLLDHPTRAAIYEAVGAQPGVHFAALKRCTGAARGTLGHHLRRLVDAGLLVEHRGDGYRCFFRPEEAHGPLLEAAEVVRAASARRILASIVDAPGIQLQSVAAAAGVSHPTASYHVHRMADHELVFRLRQGTCCKLYATELGRRMAEHVGPGAREPSPSSKNPPQS